MGRVNKETREIKEILELNDVRIVFRNFSGKPSPYNREGDRNFAVVIDDPEVAEALANDGWNVKIKEPLEEGDKPFCFLTVKVKFNRDNPRLNPTIYLVAGKKRLKLDEEMVGILDEIDIENVSMDIRPYNYDVNGKTGVSAYLLRIMVVQEMDRFMIGFADEECPEE